MKTKRVNISIRIVEKDDSLWLTLYKSRGLTEQMLYLFLSQQGYQHTSAEEENLALFSCEDILKNAKGKLFYHQKYQIRSLFDDLKLNHGEPIVMPLIELDEEETT